MAYSRRQVTNGVTVINKDLYDNLQDGIDEVKEVLDNLKETVVTEGSDYGEVGTWYDGNPSNEDRLYRFVTIVGDNREINIANSTDQIVGTSNIKSNIGFLGNYNEGDDNDPTKVIVSILGISYVKTEDDTIVANDRVISDDDGYAVKSSNNFGYRVLGVIETGLLEIVVSPNTDMIQRIRTKVSDIESSVETVKEAIDKHTNNTSNPHKVTKQQVGLDKCDNTSDADKPISTATQNALDNIGSYVEQIPLDSPSSTAEHQTVIMKNLHLWLQTLIDDVYTLSNSFLDKTYPVGSIYMSVSNVNPSTLFGGTWVAWGSGRVPVGVNTNNSNFNTVEKMGGSLEESIDHTHTMAHTHTMSHTHDLSPGYACIGFNGTNSNIYMQANNDVSNVSTNTIKGSTNWTGSSSANSNVTELGGSTGSSSASKTGSASNSTTSEYSKKISHLQPYITCYMWKRTA